MKNINEKATVCINKTCATVYGDTARIISGIVLLIMTIVAISIIAKAIK